MAGLFNKDEKATPEMAEHAADIQATKGYDDVHDAIRTYTSAPSNIFTALEKVNKELERAIENANTLQGILGK